MITLVAGFHFHVQFYSTACAGADLPVVFALFGSGSDCSSPPFPRPRPRRFSFPVFFLLPVFVLSGAFAPLEQLPQVIRIPFGSFPTDPFLPGLPAGKSVSRGPEFYLIDLVVLFAGALVTFIGAAFLLRQMRSNAPARGHRLMVICSEFVQASDNGDARIQMVELNSRSIAWERS